jgi:hypothetical protein
LAIFQAEGDPQVSPYSIDVSALAVFGEQGSSGGSAGEGLRGSARVHQQMSNINDDVCPSRVLCQPVTRCGAASGRRRRALPAVTTGPQAGGSREEVTSLLGDL